MISSLKGQLISLISEKNLFIFIDLYLLALHLCSRNEKFPLLISFLALQKFFPQNARLSLNCGRLEYAVECVCAEYA